METSQISRACGADPQRTAAAWTPPALPSSIPQGDMPGDKIVIGEEHIRKANTLYPALLPLLAGCTNPSGRTVITVCGGSGVGKSEIASILAYYLRAQGIGSYVLSGDNYPRRIPRENDAERLRVYRVGGLRGLIAGGCYDAERAAALMSLQKDGSDADPASVSRYPWLSVYQRSGAARLGEYLGSSLEQDFDELSGIVAQFKQGAQSLWLKRMGRETTELWYDQVDMRGVSVLLIEWTHGNSDHYDGVDIPILLNSTPAETLAHRRARNRDGATDSPFTTLVLQLEQRLLETQAHKAKLILSKSGELLSYAQYRSLMAQQ